MGFFTKDSTPSPDGTDVLAPLNKDRINHGLEAQSWSYSVDSDGDIGGGWEYASFHFMLNVKGRRAALHPRQLARPARRRRVREHRDDRSNWNAERLWP